MCERERERESKKEKKKIKGTNPHIPANYKWFLTGNEPITTVFENRLHHIS